MSMIRSAITMLALSVVFSFGALAQSKTAAKVSLSALEGEWGVTAAFRANHDFPGVRDLACDAFPRKIAVLDAKDELARLEISAGNVQGPVTALVKDVEAWDEGLVVSTEIGNRPVQYLLRKDGQLQVFYTPPGSSRPMPGLPLERCQPKAFF